MKKKILAVDDEENICLLYDEEFKDEGYNVITAKTGKEAIKLFEKEKPDIVILDINMPEMNGIEILRILKEKSSKTPVIMSTAYAHYKQDFTVWAADAYIIKSPDLTELKQKVKELLST